ncbi:type VI secretion system lipoprotein TssJ [Celerinatantimonas yamalensis]|uniref:Type VI secretion system lipoprotein TssJ n=1 Tax=Celerinatantimonas yamalensis TaxID=559956 RepID=A0ABW9G5A8_9GAMM
MHRYLLLIGTSLLLSACSVFGSSDNPVDYANQPSTVTFSLVSLHDANSLTNNGKGVPIKFKVFELEDDSLLKAADYDELNKNYKSVLGSNYVDDFDYILTPSQFKFVEPIKVDKDARYIGVVANYAEPNKSQWKKVIKIDPVGHQYHVLMLFRSNEVVLKKVE